MAETGENSVTLAGDVSESDSCERFRPTHVLRLLPASPSQERVWPTSIVDLGNDHDDDGDAKRRSLHKPDNV